MLKILATYQKEVDTAYYDAQLYRLYKNLQETYGYSDLDAFLVLKDILGAVWNPQSKSSTKLQ